MITAFICTTLALVGCGSPQDPSPPRLPAAAPASVQLFTSSGTASVGSRIAVSLGGTMADGTALAGAEGWIRFDPAALRYVGRAADPATTIAANDSGAARGRVRVAAVRPARLDPDAAVLAFDVLRADYLGTLSFAPGATVSPGGTLQRGSGTQRAQARSTLSARVTLRAPGVQKQVAKHLVVPTIYGDADASGAVAQADAELVGAWVVGSGEPPDSVAFNSANVAPQNLPGVGGPSDTLPPGWGAPFVWGGFVRRATVNDPIAPICERMLAIDDLLLISQEASGTNVEVPGEVMPMGSVRPSCADMPNPIPQLVPDTIAYPADTTVVVTSPNNPLFQYYRTLYGVSFAEPLDQSLVGAFLQRYGGTIVGGFGRGGSLPTLVVEVPDPGPTWAAVDSLMNDMGRQPGVLLAGKMTFRGHIYFRGRYPVDAGFAQSRSSWWNPANIAVRPFRDIRANLAWGCETGLYGGELARVGVLDSYFDVVPQDLSSSQLRRWIPSSTLLSQAGPAMLAHAHHGYSVAGLIAAEGDNGTAMAGVVWRTRLDLFALGTNAQTEVKDLVPYFARVLRLADSLDTRVLNLSLSVGDIGDSAQVHRLREALERYLGGDPRRLVVQAVGDTSLTMPISQLANSADTRLGALDRALAQLHADPAYRNKILFVSGTATGTSNFRSVSNYWQNADQIAAPAENIASLLSSGQVGGLFQGTSFATALVTGVAAQLWAADPSLTAAEVKSYILRGAQGPQEDPATGVTPPSADSLARRVQGAPGPLYLLDAYGSLTLLSRERQGTPLCGLETVYRYNPVQQTFSVTANRQAPELIISNAPQLTVQLTDALSVAQGGRLLAIGNQPYQLQDGSWTAMNPVADVSQVVYLERDVVALRLVPNGTRIDLFARLNQGAEQFLTTGLPNGVWGGSLRVGVSSVSPTGDFVHFGWGYLDGDFCTLNSVAGGGEYVARLRAGGRQVLNEWSFPECATPSPITGTLERGIVAWKRDGTMMMRALEPAGGGQFSLKRYDAATSVSLVGTGATLVGYAPSDIHWSPEGGRITLRERESASATCRLAIREAAAPHELLEPALLLNPEACAWQPRLVPLRNRLITALGADRGRTSHAESRVRGN